MLRERVALAFEDAADAATVAIAVGWLESFPCAARTPEKGG
jgi:hypothetical protein